MPPRTVSWFLAALAALIIGVTAVVYWGEARFERTVKRADAQASVQLQLQGAQRDLATVVSDLDLLIEEVRRHSEGPLAAQERWRTLGEHFVSMGLVKRHYDNLRVLDGHGHARLTVAFREGEPAVTIVTREDAATEAVDPFFASIAAPELGITFALSVSPTPPTAGEEEESMWQSLPVFRLGAALVNEAGELYFVGIDYKGAMFLSDIPIMAERKPGQPVLVHKDGACMSCPNRAEIWPSNLDPSGNADLSRLHPGAWKMIARRDAGQFVDAEGLFSFATLRVSGTAPTVGQGAAAALRDEWKLVAHLPAGLLTENARQLAYRVGLVGLILFILIGIAVIYIARELNRRERKQRRVSDALEQEQRARRIISFAVEQSTNALLIVDSELKVEYANLRCLEALGREFDAVMGIDCRELSLAGESPLQQAAYEPLFSAAAQHVHWHGELRVEPPGRHGWLASATVSPLHDPDGKWSKAVIVLQDVSERVAAELALKDKIGEVERFSYALAHDLKAPALGVSRLAEWLRDELKDGASAEAAKLIGLMLDRSTRMCGLIDGVLDFARVEREGQATATMVDVGELLREFVSLLPIPKGFVLRFEGSMPTIFTARVALQRVLLNLVSNALKHHGGQEGVVRVIASEHADGCEFVVADDGRGIPSQFQAKIFEPFHSLPPLGESRGTGMGLTIAAKLVQHNGGELRVESAPGMGAAFRFVWRAAKVGQPDEGYVQVTAT